MTQLYQFKENIIYLDFISRFCDSVSGCCGLLQVVHSMLWSTSGSAQHEQHSRFFFKSKTFSKFLNVSKKCDKLNNSNLNIQFKISNEFLFSFPKD